MVSFVTLPIVLPSRRSVDPIASWRLYLNTFCSYCGQAWHGGTSSRHAVPTITAPFTASFDAGPDNESLHRRTKHCTNCTRVSADPRITALTRPTSKVSMDGIASVAIRPTVDAGSPNCPPSSMTVASRSRCFFLSRKTLPTSRLSPRGVTGSYFPRLGHPASLIVVTLIFSLVERNGCYSYC